jgi:penicillin-binding protein 2
MHRESDRTRAFTRRALLLGGSQLGLFAALAGRLYYLQVVNADEYALLADENRINHRLLPPERGRVLDRHGVPLARNGQTYRVLIVREQSADLRRTLRALSRLIALPEERIEAVIAEAQARRPFVPITVREDLNWTEVSRISINGPDLPGSPWSPGWCAGIRPATRPRMCSATWDRSRSRS